MEHVWTVFCRRTIIDSETGQIGIIDCIDDLSIAPRAGQKKAFTMDCVVATLWARSDVTKPERGRFRVRLLTPSGISLGEQQIYPLDLEQNRWLRTRMALPGLPIDGAGRYVFVTELEEEDGGWRSVARTPYELEIQPREETPTEVPRKKSRHK